MENIIFKTKYLTYEISADGRSAAFTTVDGEAILTDAPAAVIAENDRSIIPSVGASLSGDRLTLRFADGKECTVTDLFGNVLDRPAFVGIPEAASGRSAVTLEAENEKPDYRARLTVITLGEILQ